MSLIAHSAVSGPAIDASTPAIPVDAAGKSLRSTEDAMKTARILLVDDQIASVCLLQNVLNRLGFGNVKYLTDARTVLEEVLLNQPDLIILDLHMPFMSGYEVLQQLGVVIPRDAYLPVLVLTGDGTAPAKRRALAVGATDFLNKPFDVSEVFMRIRNLLRTRFLQMEVQSQNVLLEEKVAARTRELSEALSELKATQQRVLQQERLHAFSEMAGGVVHDFNNALMSVIGYSDLLLATPEVLEDRETALDYLRTMNTAGRDAAHVVNRLRDFYRPRELADVFAPLDLNPLLVQVVQLTQPKWKDQAMATGRTISVELDLEKIPLVDGNEAELRELTTNLIFNAVDAMPKGGTITLRTRRSEEGATFEVDDTGTGMTEEVRARCLEPFFSTKGQNGTGLGLSMVFGVVKRHRATLDVRSEVGRGTTFQIQFPACVDSIAPTKDAEPAPSRSLRVLVVDDEPVSRRVVSTFLQIDGHEVIAVSNGTEALSEFERRPFDLLLTDCAMPEMSGFQLAGAVKQIRRGQPVILLTGFSESALQSYDENSEVDLVIHKPVQHHVLRRAVAQATGSVGERLAEERV
ncbi:response regulator [Verrucomicrobiota bacterium sgz303538]